AELGLDRLDHIYSRVVALGLSVPAGPRQFREQPELLTLGPARIDSDRSATADERQEVDDLLGFLRENGLAAVVDDVLQAPGNEQATEVILIPEVAGPDVSIPPEKACRFLRIAEIATGVGRAADDDLPDLTR